MSEQEIVTTLRDRWIMAGSKLHHLQPGHTLLRVGQGLVEELMNSGYSQAPAQELDVVIQEVEDVVEKLKSYEP